MGRRQVRDVMTADVVTVHEHTPFKEIARVMSERRISGLPVVDDGGRVVGVVTEGDLLRKEEFKDESSPPRLQSPRGRREREKAAGRRAASLMSAPAITVRADDSVVAVARLLHGRGIKRVPVVTEDGRLEGIVSRADLLKLFVRSDVEIASEVRREIIDRYFRTDSVHVRAVDGVVILDGEVENRSEIPLIVRMAASVDGVVDVVDHLSYAVDDTHPRASAHLPPRPPTPTPRF